MLNIDWKDCCWSSNTLATWCKEPTHWKRPWCWERLRAEEKGAAEDEMVGWHHWPNGDEFAQTLGDAEGQGSLACCSPWGCKESDTTELKRSVQVKGEIINFCDACRVEWFGQFCVLCICTHFWSISIVMWFLVDDLRCWSLMALLGFWVFLQKWLYL